MHSATAIEQPTCIDSAHIHGRPTAQIVKVIMTMHSLAMLHHNVCCVGGLRSTQSMSAISSTPDRSPVASHRAMKGHRTHGSQTALNFLAGSCSPSSPHRIPRTAEVPQGIAQSAPVMGEGLLASEGRNLSHGQSHGWSHDVHWPSSSSSPGSRTSLPPSSLRECSWRLNHSSEGLAPLR